MSDNKRNKRCARTQLVYKRPFTWKILIQALKLTVSSKYARETKIVSLGSVSLGSEQQPISEKTTSRMS